MIKIDKATVQLTEQTVKELVKAIEQAKQNLDLIGEEQILVRSEFSGIEYEIGLERHSQSQGSLGYRFAILRKPDAEFEGLKQAVIDGRKAEKLINEKSFRGTLNLKGD